MTDQLLILAQLPTTPRLDSMYWLMLASRILHILGAIILVGGIFYLRNVVIPLPLRDGLGDGSSADQQFSGRRATWAMWVGITSLFLLVTGLWNFVHMVIQNHLHWSYHLLGTLKIVLGLALMFVSALLAGRTTAAERFRQNMRFWLNICLILGIVTVIIGSVMRSYPRLPKLDALPAPPIIAE
jgi:uncharacterized membrane protein